LICVEFRVLDCKKVRIRVSEYPTRKSYLEDYSNRIAYVFHRYQLDSSVGLKAFTEYSSDNFTRRFKEIEHEKGRSQYSDKMLSEEKR
jgi:hypothetical protein